MKKLLQTYLQTQGLYSGAIDGLVGAGTLKAVYDLLSKKGVPAKGWSDERMIVAGQQIMAKDSDIEVGDIDGFNGPQTRYAMEMYVRKLSGEPVPETWRDKDIGTVAPKANSWPAYRDMVKFYGQPGNADCTAGKVKPPYEMLVAWDLGSKVSVISCHEKVADSMQRVLTKVASAYSPAQIKDMGLNLFGGCFNKRLMRGGSHWSVHSWGAAVDWDPTRNMLKTHSPTARLSHPDAVQWFKLWEEEKWLSLGRTKNYDWMHVQACGL